MDGRVSLNNYPVHLHVETNDIACATLRMIYSLELETLYAFYNRFVKSFTKPECVKRVSSCQANRSLQQFQNRIGSRVVFERATLFDRAVRHIPFYDYGLFINGLLIHTASPTHH